MEKVLVSSRKRITVPSPRPTAVREIQLIDRTEEMQVLREAADRAIQGEGGVVFLYGEAGIGKTRLARELGAYARSRGMQVLCGRCPALFRMDGVPPYVLWEEVIKDYLEICTPEQLFRVIGSYPVEVSKLVPELKQKLRTFPQSFPLSPEHSRDRLFEAVSQFITNISKEAPLLVILDDLQWTDQSSLLLLHYLARGVYKESLLLLGAYRDTNVDKKHPLSPVLTELNRERLLQPVPLKRMSYDDTSEMIKRILEQDDVPKKFGELVYKKTRGNPFFIEEVIRSLKEEEVVYREKNKWEIKKVSRIEFPETVKDVIKARIDRLGDECQRVLTMASFVGKEFTFEALLGLTNLEEEKLLEIVETLTKAGFVNQKVIHGKDVCSFADIIVRDVVNEEVSPLRRKKLHRIVGDALEQVYSKDIDEHFGELALHFLESGDKEKALDYFLKAGEQATKIYANDEAASYFQSALELLEEKEDHLQEKCHVLEKLGDLKGIVGESQDSIKYWNNALFLWRQLHGTENVSRLHRKIATVLGLVMGNMKEAREHQDKALRILESETESVELAMLYADIARLSWHSGEVEEARPWAQKALELAKKLGAFEVIAEAYTNLALVSSVTGDRQKTIEHLEKALKIALERNYVESALRIYNNLANEHSYEENEKSVKRWEEGFELAKKAGHVGWISWMGTALSGMYANSANITKALDLAEQSAALDRKTRSLANLSLSLAGLGYIYQILGEWDKSEQYYKEAVDVSERSDRFQAIARSYAYLGWFYIGKGEYIKAKELYEKAIKISENAGASSYVMFFSRGVIWASVELGEFDRARIFVNKLLGFAIKKKQRELIAGANALKAMLLRGEKKWQESVRYFEKSLNGYEALNARRWNLYVFAKVLYEYARLYLERNKRGDGEKTRSLLNQALEMFQKIGAKKDIEKVRSKMTRLETGREIAEPEPVAEVVLPEHVSTGYEDLDDLLFGGLPRNYAVILTSPSCDERDLMIKRFLEAGAKNGEVTFYVTIDPGEVKSLTDRSNFYLVICNPQADRITKDMPNVFKLKGVENLTDINIALTSAFRKLNKSLKGSRRICVEVISDILLQHHAVQTRRWLTGLLTELKSRGFTTLAVMDSEIHPPQEVRAIVGVFQGEINIHKKGTKKFLRIEKMLNQEYLENEIPLEKEKLRE